MDANKKTLNQDTGTIITIRLLQQYMP